MLDILARISPSEALSQICCQSLNENGSVIGSLFTRLLKLNKTMSYQPIYCSYDGVYRTGGGSPGGVNNSGQVCKYGFILSMKLFTFLRRLFHSLSFSLWRYSRSRISIGCFKAPTLLGNHLHLDSFHKRTMKRFSSSIRSGSVPLWSRMPGIILFRTPIPRLSTYP